MAKEINEYPSIENGVVLKCITGTYVVTNVCVRREITGDINTEIAFKNCSTGECFKQDASLVIDSIVSGRAEIVKGNEK